MRSIVHISDLHFGTEDPAMLADLSQHIAQLAPTLVVISGDLTQRARAAQFRSAKRFLESLPFPYLVVPGNHDVAPWFRFWDRLSDGLADYRRHITSEMAPHFSDDEIAVFGINTARSLTAKGGRINQEQVGNACGKFQSHGDGVVRIVVTHHPFDLPAGADESDLIGGAHKAMARFADSRVDLFLAGHLHVTHSCESAHRYQIRGHSAIVAQAGTATSRRVRGEKNSWNLIRIAKPEITIERYEWSETEKRFRPQQLESFRCVDGGWVRSPELGKNEPLCKIG